MNNFFLKERDFDLFKKALRSTKNEPVVINILSTDSSLEENSEIGGFGSYVLKYYSNKNINAKV